MHSHGVLRVPEYVKKLTVGGVDPRGSPFVVRDVGACHGRRRRQQHGPDRHALRHAARGRAGGQHRASPRWRYAAATTAARWPPMCCRRSQHDMIGIVTTNALPTMAPWGGAERLLGINPLGVGIPAGEERPIVYDAAFSASAHGKIRVLQAARPAAASRLGARPGGPADDRPGRRDRRPAAADRRLQRARTWR